jgi:hypothetical protein
MRLKFINGYNHCDLRIYNCNILMILESLILDLRDVVSWPFFNKGNKMYSFGMKGRIQPNVYKENWVEQKIHKTWNEYKRVITYSHLK